MVGAGVLLSDPEFDEFVLESVAGGSPAVSEPGREHQTVVGQGGERDAVLCDGVSEGGDHDRAGDGSVGGD